MVHDPGLESAAGQASTSATALGCLVIAARLCDMAVTVDDLVPAAADRGTVTTAQLRRCARRIGLEAAARTYARRDVSALRNAGPLIVKFVDGSSMVLIRIEQRQGVLRLTLENRNADADNLLVMDQYRFADVWTGETIKVTRRFRLGDDAMPFGFGLIFAAILSEKRMLAHILVAAFAMSLVALAPALFIKTLSFKVVLYRSVNTWATFLFLVGCEVGFAYFRRYYAARMMARVDVKLSGYLFNRLLNLPMDHFERVPTGITIHRVSELAKIRNFLSRHLFGTVLDLGPLIFFIPAMLYIDWLMTCVALGLFVALVTAIVLMLPYYRVRSGAVVREEANRSAFAMQTIAGIRTVKSLALDARQRHMWQEMTDRLSLLRVAEGNMGNAMQTVTSFIERLITAGTLGIAVYIALVERDFVQVSTLYVFYLLITRTAAPLQQLAQLISHYDEARSAIGLVGDLVNQPAEEGRRGQGVVQPVRGHIEFRNVRFKYKGAFRPALDDVSFDVPRGTTLGVMGRSGSGKTTLTRLLQKLHSDYRGQVLVDGVDLHDYDIDHLRGSLGVVLQDNFLFSGTIRDNIKAPKADATFEEMVQAARLAGAEEFHRQAAARLRDGDLRGLEQPVGRPAPAPGDRPRPDHRPKILILDEATSALDAESEAIVNENLRQIASGRTLIVISHRLSSLIAADAILVMEQGTVHDIGTHTELLGRCDIYSGLWHRQNQHAEAEGPGETLLLRGASVG